jgi:hypothetical protein
MSTTEMNGANVGLKPLHPIGEMHMQFDDDTSMKVADVDHENVYIEFKGLHANIVFSNGKGKIFKLFIKPKEHDNP